jgi:hypothetical protein
MKTVIFAAALCLGGVAFVFGRGRLVGQSLGVRVRPRESVLCHVAL